jgi:hypothetical protein
MIDTDKYEGVKGSLVHIIPHEVWVTLTPAAQALIADAPLLLAEVKRLREALITVQHSLIWDEKDRAMDCDPITLEALVAQVEQVRSDITEMIE